MEARGGRRRPSSFLCRVDGVHLCRVARLNFVRLPDALFYVLLLWRLSVGLAAPALDEDGCDSTYAGPQRSEDARCANALI